MDKYQEYLFKSIRVSTQLATKKKRLVVVIIIKNIFMIMKPVQRNLHLKMARLH